MAWTVLRTVTDSVDYVTAADHNETKANFDIVGGADGATKTGNWYVSGNVGIGTTSPRNLFELAASTVATSSSTTLRIGGIVGTYTAGNYTAVGQEVNRHSIVFSSWRDAQTDTLGAKIQAINYTSYASGGGTNFHLVQNTDLAFYTLGVLPTTTDATVERMRITSAGNVGIGTTTPTEFHVYRANAGSNLMGIFENSSAASASNAILQVKSNASNGYAGLAITSDSSDYIFFQKQNGTEDARITVAGSTIYFAVTSSTTEKMRINSTGIGIGSISPSYSLHLAADSAAKPTSNTWTISSDARVKDVIGSYTRGVADIMALEPKRYRLNGAFGSVDDGRVHVSVIAQETQATWPEMIGTYEHADKDEDGVETVTELLNLNTNELQWAMVNAIKELAQRVEALEA